jgi:hypothetical protein
MENVFNARATTTNITSQYSGTTTNNSNNKKNNRIVRITHRWKMGVETRGELGESQHPRSEKQLNCQYESVRATRKQTTERKK